MEQFTEPMEGQNGGREAAAPLGGLQVSDRLEAFESSKSISRFSSEHEIDPYMIRSWKRLLLENEPRIFCNHGKLRQTPDFLKPAEEHFVLCSEPVAFA